MPPGVVDSGPRPDLGWNPAVDLDRGHGVEAGRAMVIPDESGSRPNAAMAMGGDADELGIPESWAELVVVRGDWSVR